jgi:hypothetical protein
MKKPFSVYSTWGFHDELGDRIELDEALARKALSALSRWHDKFGIRQDFFALDAFWFDPLKGFRHFKKPHWPDGFEPLMNDILEMDMKPGLWYSVNGSRLQVPEWQESASADGTRYSLAEGPYADDLRLSLLHAAEKWNVRFFKFDFADFFTASAKSGKSPEEIYSLSLSKFREILTELRSKYPDIYIITHCGFSRNHGFSTPASPEVIGADLSLLEVVDAHFSGDPQTWDIPQTSIPRNMDLFQDHQVWKMHFEGFPLTRIEDHGIIAGTTNTCFYRGRTGFRRTHLIQLARGGGRDMFYGNPELLDDGDLQYMRNSRKLYFDAFTRNLTTRFIGGEPGVAEWHGFVTGGGSCGLAYLVNPRPYRREISLNLPCLANAAVLFFDGINSPQVQVQPDQLRISLGPEQMLLVGMGDYADTKYRLGNEEDAGLPFEMQLLPLSFRPDNGILCADVPLLQHGTRLHVIAEVRESSPQTICSQPFRFGKQDTRRSLSMNPLTHDMLNIRAYKGQEEIKPLRRIPDVPVWAGISWVAAEFSAEVPLRIEISQDFPEQKRLRVSAYALS